MQSDVTCKRQTATPAERIMAWLAEMIRCRDEITRLEAREKHAYRQIMQLLDEVG